jgi:hypothetical protein
MGTSLLRRAFREAFDEPQGSTLLDALKHAVRIASAESKPYNELVELLHLIIRHTRGGDQAVQSDERLG